jgi:hypothetical protein
VCVLPKEGLKLRIHGRRTLFVGIGPQCWVCALPMNGPLDASVEPAAPDERGTGRTTVRVRH